MRKNKIGIAGFVLAVFGVTWYATSSVGAARPSTVEKNLAREGNISAAMDQAHVLLEAMREKNWDWKRVDWNLMRLPDQIYAESKTARNPSDFAFTPVDTQPEYNQMAFMCSLYTRVNVTIVKGVEGVTHPEGFFIVAWKDGRVEKVPVDHVGMYDVDGERQICAFPGMKEYSRKLRRWSCPEMPK